jgi:glycosyltransferase involved in cell wall biosynthesis
MTSVRIVEQGTSKQLSVSAQSFETPKKTHRVLYIQHGGGGTATALYDLVQDLDKSLYEPIVLFYEPDFYVQKFQELGVKVLTLCTKSPSLTSIVFQPETTANWQRYGKVVSLLYRLICAGILVTRVALLIKREGISLVHHNDNLRRDRFTVLAAWLAGVPQICHMHAFSQLFRFEKLLIPTVNAFIYVSKAVEKYYLDFQLPAKKGQVVYNGFNATSSDQVTPEEVLQIRSDFTVDDQEVLISNVGRLDYWKGQDYFIEAIAQVLQSHPNVKALIVGAPGTSPHLQAYYQKLQKLVADLNLSDHVIFTGFRSDIPQIMAASDILVHSASEPDPCPRVIVEGMLSGRSVIGVAAGGVPEMIDDQITGLLVPPKDASKMAEAILWLIHHPEQAARMGEVAQQKAKERFSIEHHVSSVQQLYQKILAV